MQTLLNSRIKEPTAVALGNFDGVHLGHTALIERLIESKYKKLVYTFSSHPVNVINGEGSLNVINTSEEKKLIFEELGVDAIYLEDFERVRNLSPENFVKKVLIDTLSAKEVVCGFNYRFGNKGEGDVEALKGLLSGYDVKLSVLPSVKYLGDVVSSSIIRERLLKGDIEGANKMLGRAYFVYSIVLHGKTLGRSLGFPTINLALEENRVLPEFGVYVGRVPLDGVTYPAVVNVGIRPTVHSSEEAPVLEAHIVGFKGDLYGRKVKVELLSRLRDEIKFATLNELKKQVEKDIEECKKYFTKGTVN